MSKLTLSSAEKIVDAALAKGAELGLKPLTVAMLDAGGHFVVIINWRDSYQRTVRRVNRGAL